MEKIWWGVAAWALVGLWCGGAKGAWAAEGRFPLLREDVTVRTLPRTPVAYVEHVGDVEGNGAVFDEVLEGLLAWAEPAGLWHFPEETRLYMIYPDDPGTTPKDRRRLWVGINVPEGIVGSGSIRTTTLPETLCAVGPFAVTAEEFGAAWGYLLGEWLPQSGYVPAEGVCFEIQTNDSSAHPEGKHVVDVCVPVRKQ